MTDLSIKNVVKRFPGQYGWYYVELDEDICKDLRPILKSLWPSLLEARLSLGETTWNSSIMPIKDGPLFIALPAKVRKSEKIDEGHTVSVKFKLLV